jgi:hypothetical protein
MLRFLNKITTLFLFVLFFINAQAQDLFFEGFENGMPPNFTLIDNDGLTPFPPYMTEAWIVREDFSFDPTDSVAISTSFYSPAGQADDWMITPAITTGANTMLSWDAMAYNANYPDGYEVYVGTSNNMNDFLNNTPVFSIDAEQTSFITHNVNLSAFDNQTVFVAFRNNSDDKNLLFIDDIRVYEDTTQSDFTFTETTTGYEQYSQVPLSLNPKIKLSAVIKNIGEQAGDFFASVQVVQNNFVIYYQGDDGVLNKDESTTTLFENVLLNDTGLVTITYQLNVANDSDTTNNTVEHRIYISEEKLSKDDGVYTGAFGDGALNTPGMLANVFTNIPPNSELYAIEYLSDPSGQEPSANYWAKGSIYSVSPNGDPDQEIAITDSILISGAGPDLLVLPIIGGPLLVSDKFAIILHDPAETGLQVAFSNSIYTPRTNWFLYNNEWLYFRFALEKLTFHTRALFGDKNISVPEIQSREGLMLTALPNPVKNKLTISINNLSNKASLSIYNTLGQVILMDVIKTKTTILDTENWKTGSYMVVVNDGTTQITKHIIKQ